MQYSALYIVTVQDLRDNNSNGRSFRALIKYTTKHQIHNSDYLGPILNDKLRVNLIFLKDDKNGRAEDVVHTAVIEVLASSFSRRADKTAAASGEFSHQNSSHKHGFADAGGFTVVV